MAIRTAVSSVAWKLSSTINNTLDDGTVSSYAGGFDFKQNLASGVQIAQASRFWQQKANTLVAAASRTIDLHDLAAEDIGAGAGLDALGLTNVNMLEIVTFVIKVTAGTGTLAVEQGASNGWTPVPVLTVALANALRLDGHLILHQQAEQGLAVTNTSKTIKLTAAGSTMTYDIYILGRHDVDESSSSSSSSSSPSSTSSSSKSSSSHSSSSLSSSSSSSSSSPSSASSASSESSSSSQSP